MGRRCSCAGRKKEVNALKNFGREARRRRRASRLRARRCAASFHFAKLLQTFDRPRFKVRARIAKKIEEEGLGEGVELGEGGAALGPQRLRLVQNLRNPTLLR